MGGCCRRRRRRRRRLGRPARPATGIVSVTANGLSLSLSLSAHPHLSASSGCRPVALAAWPGPPAAPPISGPPAGKLIICSLHGRGLADETSRAQAVGWCSLLPCRVVPIERGVVANVPASLHGTVMPPRGEPIPSPRRPRRRLGSGARNAKRSVGQRHWEDQVSLGPGANPPSLTSEI